MEKLNEKGWIGHFVTLIEVIIDLTQCNSGQVPSCSLKDYSNCELTGRTRSTLKESLAAAICYIYEPVLRTGWIGVDIVLHDIRG